MVETRCILRFEGAIQEHRSEEEAYAHSGEASTTDLERRKRGDVC